MPRTWIPGCKWRELRLECPTFGLHGSEVPASCASLSRNIFGVNADGLRTTLPKINLMHLSVFGVKCMNFCGR